MRILVLTDRFVPEIAAPSFRVMDHAKIWREYGHEVVVVTCAPNFPRGKLFPGYDNRLYQEEVMDGIRVVRVWSYVAANEGLLKRAFDYVSFMCSAVLQCSRFPPFDIMLASSPPLLVALAGYVISRIRKRPWVFEVRDLWPASIGAVGVAGETTLAFLEKLELFLYRASHRIMVLTNSFKTDLERRGVPSDRIDVVENGVDETLFDKQRVTSDPRPLLGVYADLFLTGYIGTVGMAHGLRTILEAAVLCRDHEKIRFLIMGEGAERKRLEHLARSWRLENVIFKDFVPHDDMPNYLACLDALIVHLNPHPVFRTVIPSKIFESMAMGTPMIYAVEGEGARIVEESGAGVCIPSGDAQRMAETVIDLSRDAERCKRMGLSGQLAVREKYTRTVKAMAALKCLETAMAGRSGLKESHTT